MGVVVVASGRSPSAYIRGLIRRIEIGDPNVEMTTFNTGSFYNENSGLFTCPSSGLYKFDWALAFYAPNITHTDTGKVADKRGYTLDVDFVIVYLNRNDTAGATNPDDAGVFVPYLSKFSGFKI